MALPWLKSFLWFVSGLFSGWAFDSLALGAGAHLKIGTWAAAAMLGLATLTAVFAARSEKAD